MQDLLPEYLFLTTKMAISTDSGATIVFSTCELVIMDIRIFFWRCFWRRYGRISSYRFSTGFFYQIILYRDLLLQATALAGYSVPSTEFSTQYHYYYPLRSGLRVFEYCNGPNRSNSCQNCPPKYQNRLWRKVPTIFYMFFMIFAQKYRNCLSTMSFLLFGGFKFLKSPKYQNSNS